MSNDLTFITNDAAGNLRDRFATLIQATQNFDVLVGYFYTSGFHAMYPSLEATDRIRILIGISTNRETFDLNRYMSSIHLRSRGCLLPPTIRSTGWYRTASIWARMRPP